MHVRYILPLLLVACMVPRGFAQARYAHSQRSALTHPPGYAFDCSKHADAAAHVLRLTDSLHATNILYIASHAPRC